MNGETVVHFDTEMREIMTQECYILGAFRYPNGQMCLSHGSAVTVRCSVMPTRTNLGSPFVPPVAGIIHDGMERLHATT